MSPDKQNQQSTTLVGISVNLSSSSHPPSNLVISTRLKKFLLSENVFFLCRYASTAMSPLNLLPLLDKLSRLPYVCHYKASLTDLKASC